MTPGLDSKLFIRLPDLKRLSKLSDLAFTKYHDKQEYEVLQLTNHPQHSTMESPKTYYQELHIRYSCNWSLYLASRVPISSRIHALDVLKSCRDSDHRQRIITRSTRRHPLPGAAQPAAFTTLPNFLGGYRPHFFQHTTQQLLSIWLMDSRG